MKGEALSILRLIGLLAVGLVGAVAAALVLGVFVLGAVIVGLVGAAILSVAWFVLRPKGESVKEAPSRQGGPVIETEYRDITDERR